MKRFVSLMLVLLLLLCAAGCRQEEAQTPSTTVPTETAETTEPQPTLSVRELYWKMRNALGMRYPFRYTKEITMTYRIGTGEVAMESELRDREQVIYSATPMHFNIASERTEITEGEETVSRQVTYYRSKDSNKAEMYVYFDDPWDEWIYVEPTDYSYYMLWDSQKVLHPTSFPEDLTLDPETQTVEGREAYVLRRNLTAEDFLGEEPTEESEEDLEQLLIEEQLFVDTETYMLLQTKTEVKEAGEEMSKMLYLVMTGVEYTNKKYPLTVTSFVKTYNGLDYDPVEVPPIPEEAYDALDGFGAT